MKVKRRALRIIERDGITTSNRDPGSRCPKCGGAMCYDQDWDDYIRCENSIWDHTLSVKATCDFEYWFTEYEYSRNNKKDLLDMDRAAAKRAVEFVKQHGPPVFGVTPPGLFVPPSARYGDDEEA